MPRSRGSDASQRQSPRVPLHLKSTASSEANAVRRATGKERSPKVSPRGGVSQEGRRGMKLVDLETRLSKVQEELKKLTNRLASAEVAKIEAEQALVTAKKRIPAASSAPKELGEEDERPPPPRDAAEEDNREQESKSEGEVATSPETMDVFEVVIPAESVPEEMKTMVAKEGVDEDGKEKEEKKGDALVEDLKTKLLEKEKEAEILLEENMIFKTHAAEEAKRIASAAEEAETELLAKLSSMEEEMEESKARARRMAEQLEAAEGAKTALEEEMKRLRVQTEQWRKAAEAAAAAVLADDDDDEVDKHIAAWASPLAMEDGDWRRRKGAGIRMFGELWKKKKKGQQK